MESRRTMVHKIVPPPFTPGVYRHYKGWEYEAIGLACNEADVSWSVIYKPLYPHENMPDMWSRAYDDFMAELEHEGEIVRRFTLIKAYN